MLKSRALRRTSVASHSAAAICRVTSRPSQNSGGSPIAADSTTAISPEMTCFPLISSFTVEADRPSTRARSVCVHPRSASFALIVSPGVIQGCSLIGRRILTRASCLSLWFQSTAIGLGLSIRKFGNSEISEFHIDILLLLKHNGQYETADHR